MTLAVKSISLRIVLGLGTLVIVSSAISIGVGIYQMRGLAATAENRELRGYLETLKSAIAAETSKAETLAALVAHLPPAQDMLAKRDREGLTKLFLPAFEALKKNYAVTQFHFHLPPATSLLRLHGLDKFGDDMSAERLTVLATNTNKSPTVGLETGAGGLGVRGVVPVSQGGKHVGSLEFGTSFGQAFFDSFKARFSVDAALYIRDKGGFKAFATTLGKADIVGRDQIDAAFAGNPTVVRSDLNGIPTSIVAGPVTDFSGKTIGVAIIARNVDDYVTALSRSRNTSLLLGGLVLVVGVLVAVAMGRRLSAPIRLMTAAMGQLAEGDLEVAIPAAGRADEIGRMAKAVQVFKDNAIDKVRLEAEQAEREKQAEAEKQATMVKLAGQFEAAVGAVVDQVSSAATEMLSSSEAMSATAEETTRQASAVAAASEQASANVETVASAAEELSSSISEISRQVTQASQIAAAAVTEAEKTNVKVQGLAQAANKIGEVVALITDIAEQTNLLALNATIEAARAGDAGKGFAVVASEVKNLANQTAKATDEIGAQITGIQSATREAVAAIEEITRTISKINEVNSGVASAVEEQGAATQEIARNVEQASAGTQEVSSNIAGVSAAANETGAAAGQINRAAGELSRQSETLRAEVDKFLANVRAA
ncbi:methyl-accepting chemotaxis protein [Shumkonia mesophila]|uniref:methyl-accepting chemotaxis protein n=1 Tax=Shumkonia mesophila TaxID=2838854 RepID=UPI0029345B53|nr:cache domain-containing protein [Shumkonia mesophila]